MFAVRAGLAVGVDDNGDTLVKPAVAAIPVEEGGGHGVTLVPVLHLRVGRARVLQDEEEHLLETTQRQESNTGREEKKKC